MRSRVIRVAKPSDVCAINEIYNHYVLNSTCTYQEEPSSEAERQQWLAAHGPMHPATVAEEDGRVVGWASLSAFRARVAYRWTMENAVYVHHDLQRRGIGSALLADLIERGKAMGHHSIIAVIDKEQEGSARLHRRFGFEEVAHLREVGFKFGRWLDVIYLQRML
jgi:L-amino acid N-acyltransferase